METHIKLPGSRGILLCINFFLQQNKGRIQLKILIVFNSKACPRVGGGVFPGVEDCNQRK